MFSRQVIWECNRFANRSGTIAAILFQSSTGILMKVLSAAFAGLFVLLGLISFNASAVDAKPQTIAALYSGKASLGGKTVIAQGKVVKVNNGIMNRNWIHIKDGSGDAKAKTNELLVTSLQTAEVGDQITVTGTLGIDKDFGAGYAYSLLIEDAKIDVKK
jgi:hypothetical protein